MAKAETNPMNGKAGLKWTSIVAILVPIGVMIVVAAISQYAQVRVLQKCFDDHCAASKIHEEKQDERILENIRGVARLQSGG